MAQVKNDLDIYYAVGNANTQRQESEISVIINKRNSAGWKLISTATASGVHASRGVQKVILFGMLFHIKSSGSRLMVRKEW